MNEKSAVNETNIDMGKELSKWTIMFHNAIASKLGITVTEFECLESVYRNEVTTAGDLARKTGLTTGAITNVIDRLEKSGLVKRERDPKDRRKVIIEPITGREAEVNKYFDSMTQSMLELYLKYDEKEFEIIYGFIASVINILKEETKKLQEPATPVK
ncbi:MAG: hypothetical protein A2Y23_07715 [Clostridiales bacterium GWB2_37_7]|nr:MAG: hypothetical protein A2Y23_07715 [Clostridiales bacterium GWB2_37_7]